MSTAAVMIFAAMLVAVMALLIDTVVDDIKTARKDREQSERVRKAREEGLMPPEPQVEEEEDKTFDVGQYPPKRDKEEK
jgi:hypothetical protein